MISKHPPLVVEGPNRDFVIMKFGVRCAAWLIFKHRRRFRHGRGLRFHLPTGKTLPPWFDVAFSFLKKYRTTKWETSKEVKSGTTYYAIKRSRYLPEAIRA